MVTATQSPPRTPGIDSLRGVAVAMVLLLHFTLAFGLVASPLGDLLGRPLLSALTLNGNFGVTIFFVVSGFLITRNLLRRDGRLGRIDLRRFYVERAARILPPLVLVLAIVLPLGLSGVPFFDNRDGGAAHPASDWWIVLASLLGFWHNLLMQSWGYFNYTLNVYWSLSVEEAFYVAFPLLCLLLRRTRWIVAGCVLLVAIGPWYRAQHLDSEIHYLYAYLACFDAIAIGCLVAIMADRVRPTPAIAPTLRALCAIALLAVILRGIGGHAVWSFTQVALLSGAWIWARAADPREGRVGAAVLEPLRWCGRHSYEIYLLHIVVLAGLRQFATRDTLEPAHRLPLLAGFVLLTALLAGAMARWYSEPLNRALRRRWQATIATAQS